MAFETILVNVVVLAAVLFLGRWFYRNLISRDKGSACSSCESCETTDGDESAAQSTPRS